MHQPRPSSNVFLYAVSPDDVCGLIITVHNGPPDDLTKSIIAVGDRKKTTFREVVSLWEKFENLHNLFEILDLCRLTSQNWKR